MCKSIKNSKVTRGAGVDQWSLLWPGKPEAAGLNPGCIKKGIYCQTMSKIFL